MFRKGIALNSPLVFRVLVAQENTVAHVLHIGSLVRQYQGTRLGVSRFAEGLALDTPGLDGTWELLKWAAGRADSLGPVTLRGRSRHNRRG
jgi:hypothetical protein